MQEAAVGVLAVLVVVVLIRSMRWVLINKSFFLQNINLFSNLLRGLASHGQGDWNGLTPIGVILSNFFNYRSMQYTFWATFSHG
jgi:uncharacterized membrane protein YgdD (TMEM256/DUF423 family)